MKMHNLQIVSTIISKDWLIMQSALPKLVSSIARIPEAAAGAAVWIEMSDFFELRPESTIDEDGVATIHIHNALVDACPPIYEKLGIVTRYGTVSSEISDAKASGAKGLLLVVDSPGGTVAGNIELSNEIMNLDIPVVAFASGLACSAAYKLSAGADQIVASPSAVVGNIGTIMTWANLEEFWASMGVKMEAIVSEGADLKSTFHLEPSKDQREFLQDSINRAGEQFKNHVIAGREAAGATIDPEVFRAGWYSGEHAGELGLIDAVGSLDEAKQILLDLIDRN